MEIKGAVANASDAEKLNTRHLLLAGCILVVLVFVAAFGAWSSVTGDRVSNPPQRSSPWDFLSLAEKHAGLGGWVGALGALVAIGVTAFISSAQTRRDRAARHAEREQYIELIVSIIEDLEILLAPFLRAVREGFNETPDFWHSDLMNSPEMAAGRDLIFTPIRDWPSVGSYRHYRIYWSNTNSALEEARGRRLDPQSTSNDLARLSEKIRTDTAIRDAALIQLKQALSDARTLSI